VVLSFGAGISAYFDADEAEYELDAELPTPPRPWGPFRRRPTDYASLLGQSNVTFPLSHQYPVMRRGHIDNSGSARIVFEPVHLRPDYRVNLAPIHVIVPADECVGSASVSADWYATSTSVSGSARGTLTVPLGEPTSFEELLY
jgi:hypothetical protein